MDLAGLRERRAKACRLTEDRALATLDEAAAFLTERGLLTRTTDCALPSLYEACHEDPFRPGTPGFGTWPATKWPWFGDLADRGYLATATHRGKNMIVSAQVARLLDPICRAETDRMRAEDPGARRLLDHLAQAGPATTDDLREALGLKRQELKALRYPLERCGVIVARSMKMTGGPGDARASELARWDQVYPRPAETSAAETSAGETGADEADPADADPAEALKDLVVAGVRAAVVAPERELARWFSWPWYWRESLVDDLVQAGRLYRVDGHVAAGPE